MASWEELPLPRSFDSVFYGAAGGGEDLPSDDEFNRVSFLSHFEGANNGVNNVFDDGSASNHTITAAGNVTQGSFGPFARPDGEWGVDLPANGDTINLGSSTDFNFAGDFSIEMFIMDNSTDGIIFSSHKQGVATGYYLFNRPLRWDIYGAGNGFNLGNDNNPPVGVWYHFVISRQSGSMRAFIDGVLKVVVSNSSTINSSAYDFMIGGASNSSGSLDFSPAAKVSNFRIVNGSCATAYQTSSTTVGATIFAVPTGKLTAVTNTKLLTCQSNRFVDNSASAHTATPTGNVAVTSFGPFLTDAVYNPAVNGASAYFDGSGESLVVDATVISQSGNFTFEGWAYSNSTASQTIGGQYSGGGTGRMVIYSDSGNIRFYQNASPAISYNGSSGKLLNQWCHFVLMRTGSNIALYINGVRVHNVTAANIEQSDFIVGAENSSGNNSMNGYISNIRCTSSAVYSEGTSITVPTAPYSTVTNTNLLLNMADGQAIDSAAQNNLTLYGNAKISTGQAKFGNTSMVFDGTGDYVALSGSHAFSTGDYTIEMFVYHTSISGQQTYFSDAYANTAGVYFYKDSNHKLGLYYSGQIVTGSGNVPANQWVHVSVCRASGTSRLFLDGVLQGSASDTTNLTQTAYSIGDSVGTSSGEFIGYIDDIRVSKMARYTSAFTAPSAAFPDKGQDA